MQLTYSPNADGGSCSFFSLCDIAGIGFCTMWGGAIKDAVDVWALFLQQLPHCPPDNLHCDLEGDRGVGLCDAVQEKNVDCAVGDEEGLGGK
jgi:hypothetical protein